MIKVTFEPSGAVVAWLPWDGADPHEKALTVAALRAFKDMDGVAMPSPHAHDYTLQWAGPHQFVMRYDPDWRSA